MDLIKHLYKQQFFSLKTFGPGQRTDGIIDHIKKELDEIKQEPNDIEEWIDVVMLALDGAWRAGHSPDYIAYMLEHKLKKNEGREWPNWMEAEEGKAIEHIRKNQSKAIK